MCIEALVFIFKKYFSVVFITYVDNFMQSQIKCTS